MFQTPPVDPVLGNGIHDLSDNLNFILGSLIQDHLGIPYVVQNTEDTANSLLEYFSGDSGLRSRNSRTIARQTQKRAKSSLMNYLHSCPNQSAFIMMTFIAELLFLNKKIPYLFHTETNTSMI